MSHRHRRPGPHGPPASISFSVLGACLWLVTGGARARRLASALAFLPILIAVLGSRSRWNARAARSLVRVRDDGVGIAPEVLPRTPAPPPAAEPPPSRLRILIADDNIDAGDSLAMLLETLGHQMHTARDGVEALADATSLRPDVAFLDIGMPRLSGSGFDHHLVKPAGLEALEQVLTGVRRA